MDNCMKRFAAAVAAVVTMAIGIPFAHAAEADYVAAAEK